jgi:hydrogenase nickel incorporation protein HypB
MNSQFYPLDREPTAVPTNRDRLRRAGVFTINLIGGPGCGKTSLIEATMRRLMLKRRVGAIAADAHSRYDADRLGVLGDQVLHVDPGGECALNPADVGQALDRLDLPALDLLMIENVSSLVGPGGIDLGEDAKVAVFSVAAGHDKPARHPDVVRGASIVVLNKVDLLAITPFDLATFRETVARLNPSAVVMELSTLGGQGMDAWIEWLEGRSPPSNGDRPVRVTARPSK